MSPDILMSKERDGWQARSSIRLPGLPDTSGLPGDEPGRAHLDLRTTKNQQGGIKTFACVSYRSGMWSRATIFRDFAGTIASNPAARCTEKNIRIQHEAAIADLKRVLSLVAAHYGCDPMGEPG